MRAPRGAGAPSRTGGAPGLAAAIATALLALPAAAASASDLRLSGPRAVAPGGEVRLSGAGADPGEAVAIERRIGSRWAAVGSARVDRRGRFRAEHRPRRLQRRYVFRAVGAERRTSPAVRVRSRELTLLAVGDINLGDAPLRQMRVHGFRYPWTDVARVLRGGDIALGNLESAVSTRGQAVPKEFNFRGPPAALREVARYAGFDVLTLANNHAGDYGRSALLDTIRHVRRFGMEAVGAGRSLDGAGAPRVVSRLGLQVAFVGFSDILPASFFAGPRRAGTQQATMGNIARSVGRARRDADVVIATFHWGQERARRENGRQRAFAAAALRAGAHAVIGHHPHVLQPIRSRGRRLVAYSLGNFVFGGTSAATRSTGILELRLSAKGVEGHRLRRARIVNARPVLR